MTDEEISIIIKADPLSIFSFIGEEIIIRKCSKLK